MSSAKLVFFLQDLHHDHGSNYAHGWYQAVLSDGVQETTIKASSVLSNPLLTLLEAVQLLLLGETSANCSWWKGSWYEEPEQHCWLLSRKNKQIQIHIVRRPGHPRDCISGYGTTVVQMECDLLRFAKRLCQQLGQLMYLEDTEPGSPVVPFKDYQNLRETIAAFEHAYQGNQEESKVKKKSSEERTTNPQEGRKDDSSLNPPPVG